MITQETKPVKTWGGFNLVILKVNLIHYLERIEIRTIRLTSPHARPLITTHQKNLLTRPRASSESTDSFFLGFTTKYKHTRLCFFRLQWQQLDQSSRCRKLFLLENPKFMWRKAPQDLTRDSHKPQYDQH